MTEEKDLNRYAKILETIFKKVYREGLEEIEFTRDDIIQVSQALGIDLPKNIGDLVYSFRYRNVLPESIVSKAPEGFQWVIRPAGKAHYKLMLSRNAVFLPSENLIVTKIPDATPGIIARYAMNDEQALLAKLRYNRLIDIFSGLTCYSLQSHLRTTLKGGSQIEIDEVYIGLDKRGVHYVLPVQAKGKKDRIGVVQLEQDFEVCAAKFPAAVCRSIAAQWMDDTKIALFEFENTEDGVKIASEKHYRLVELSELSEEELNSYRVRKIE